MSHISWKALWGPWGGSGVGTPGCLQLGSWGWDPRGVGAGGSRSTKCGSRLCGEAAKSHCKGCDHRGAAPWSPWCSESTISRFTHRSIAWQRGTGLETKGNIQTRRFLGGRRNPWPPESLQGSIIPPSWGVCHSFESPAFFMVCVYVCMCMYTGLGWPMGIV